MKNNLYIARGENSNGGSRKYFDLAMRTHTDQLEKYYITVSHRYAASDFADLIRQAYPYVDTDTALRVAEEAWKLDIGEEYNYGFYRHPTNLSPLVADFIQKSAEGNSQGQDLWYAFAVVISKDGTQIHTRCNEGKSHYLAGNDADSLAIKYPEARVYLVKVPMKVDYGNIRIEDHDA